MPEDSTSTAPLVALRRRRQQVIDRLTEDFARDLLDVDEFDERVTKAHQATSLETLDDLVRDLVPLEKGAPPVTESQAMRIHPQREIVPYDRPERRWAVAVLGGVERKGTWRVPQRLKVVCVMGGAELDFRDVNLPPGETEVSVTCVMGGAEIIVPPDLAVECDGVAILGGFEHTDRAPPKPDPDMPLLRIKGVAFMGGFSISTRLPGESARQARKREKREQRALESERERRQLADGRGK
ncbi:MAG TPA: LiaF domain-containing protein [Kofleriaceae bacterium]|nr:LiaF domain-containing protein [Kofleriaceae bacterium]